MTDWRRWRKPARPLSPCCEYIIRPLYGRYWCPRCWCEVIRPAQALAMVREAFDLPDPEAPAKPKRRRRQTIHDDQGMIF